MPETTIVIVGAGAAGLSIGAALKKRDLEPVILEQDSRIGGTWRQRYDRLRLHTVRAFSGLAHYPIRRRYPAYLPKDMYAQYLEEYARHFDLSVTLGCKVHRVRMEGGDRMPAWIVESDCGTWRSPVLVIATGEHRTPHLGSWPDVERYRGILLHSSEYKSGRDYVGKRVLVVGTGNSGSEIAADLAEQGAASVAASIRTPPFIVPRDFLGMPVQLCGILMTPLPPKLADRLARALARLALGDLKRYGIEAPAWMPFSSQRIPVIDVGFVRELKRGRIKVRPHIARFTEKGVVYGDGREEAFDVVIAATGFKTGLDRLLDLPDVVDERGYPKYRSGEATPYPGLYFMGYTQSVRGYLLEANRDSRRLAGLIAGYLRKGPKREVAPVT